MLGAEMKGGGSYGESGMMDHQRYGYGQGGYAQDYGVGCGREMRADAPELLPGWHTTDHSTV